MRMENPNYEEISKGSGLSSPTLSMNMTGLADYGVAYPFIDLMKIGAWFTGATHWRDPTPAMKHQQLRDAGYFDEDGWPTAIPEGQNRIETFWRLGADHADEQYRLAGTYHVDYEGAGDIRVEGAVKVLSREPGKIVFRTEAEKPFYLRIYETDPEGTGDYIRDISMVHERNLDLHEAGGMFDPAWLAKIEDIRDVRFMDWMRTNNSQITSWDQMASADGPNQWKMMSVEIMVRLANEIGADPWFTMPWNADEDFNRKFATYVRDNLDPALTAKVEYSNENWNWAFKHAGWLNMEQKAEWNNGQYYDWVAKNATETALIWKDVYGDQQDRLVNVMGTQMANTWIGERLLTATEWQKIDPEGYVAPHTVFDALAVTTYWGGAMISDEPLRNELLAVLDDPTQDAIAWVTAKQLDPAYKHSVPHSERMIASNAALADKYGLDLLAYEGGQHMHHSFNVKTLTAEQSATLTKFMGDYVRSEGMATLYQASWDAWAKYGDGAYMQFADVTANSKWGMWGLYESTTDSSPRSDLLERLSAETPAWWTEAGDGSQYLNGVTLIGTAGNDILTGTLQEDYLLGGAGDDILRPGAGRDGVHGGDGIDTVMLEHEIDAYEMTVEGKGFRLNGPDGSDLLISIEKMSFKGGLEIAIGDFGDALLEAKAAKLGAPPPANLVSIKGEIFDAEGLGSVGVADLGDTGIVVHAINPWSQTARNLGQPVGEAVHVFVSKDATAVIDGQTYAASYFTLHDNKATKDGPLLTASALETALHFGTVVMNATEIVMGAGNDRFMGRNEHVTVRGGDGNDYMSGSGGRDVFMGEDGNDVLIGGAGRDVLDGGRGDDVMTGGTHMDRFIFRSGDGNDVIRDFSAHDRLDFVSHEMTAAILVENATDSRKGLTLNHIDGSVTLTGLDLFDLDWVVENSTFASAGMEYV